MVALLNLFLIFFYSSFVLGELVRFRVFGVVSSGPMDLAILFLLIYWIIKVKKNNYQLLRPILLFSLIGLFSLLINSFNFTKEQVFTSSLYLVRWIFYSSVYFVFRDIGKLSGEKINKYIISTGLLVVIAGFIQFFYYPSLKIMYYLGWDEHLNRIYSTFLDPNFTGVILVLFLITIFFLKKKFINNKILYYVILFTTFISIILTYSRGAFLMVISCALFYSFFKKDWRIIVSTVIVFIVVFVLLIPGFKQEGTNLLRTVSVNQRIYSTKTAIEIFKKNPMGVGFNTYRYAREKYGEIDTSKFGPSHAGAGVDNSLILVLVTMGVVGLMTYVYLLFGFLKLGLLKVNNGYGLVLMISVAGLVMNSLTINSLFYSFIMIWIWMIAGLTESS